MHQIISKLLAITLLAASSVAIGGAPAWEANTIAPHVNLNAALPTQSTHSALGPVLELTPISAPGEKLFNDPPPVERGWKGLARLLQSVGPGVDTSLPLTPSQITDRISVMMNQGDYAQALDIINRREAQRKAENAMAHDVQLMFLRGRALSGLGQTNEAIEHYLHMTTLFPELPEPWNNLAVEYVRQGKLHMAYDALEMAQKADSHYAAAQANMGWVQLMLAERSFENAGHANGASTAAQQTKAILHRP